MTDPKTDPKSDPKTDQHLPVFQSRDPLWLAAALTILGFAAAVLPLRTWDYWYHLTVGRLLAIHHRIPDQNIFSYVAPADTPVFIQPWIGDYWLMTLHALGGVPASLVARNLCAMATFTLVALITYMVSRRNFAATTVLTLVFGLAFLALSALAGPRMFVWPLFAGLGGLGLLVVRGHLGRWALALFPLASFLWANLAPDFLLPTALAVGMAVVDWRRREAAPIGFGLAALASLAATLATPHGLGIFVALADLGGLFDWALIAAPVLGGWLAADHLRRSRREAPRWMTVSGVLLAAILIVGLQPWTDAHSVLPAAVHGDGVRQQQPLRGHGSSDTPVEAVEIIRSWGSQPRVLADERLTGYLLFELQSPVTPEPVVWPLPDSGTEETRAFEQALSADFSVFRGLARQYEIDAVITSGRFAPLREPLTQNHEWDLVHETARHALFVPRRRVR